jgi:catechol-2,3-dioxygenase
MSKEAVAEFAGITTHDPRATSSTLSTGWKTGEMSTLKKNDFRTRHIKHIALRTVNSVGVTQFYRDILNFQNWKNRTMTQTSILRMVGDFCNHAPNIRDFSGTGVERPALDHIGFKVESVETVKRSGSLIKKGLR